MKENPFHRRRRWRWLMVLVAFALLAAACGNDDSQSADPPAPTEAEDPPADEADPPADEADPPADEADPPAAADPVELSLVTIGSTAEALMETALPAFEAANPNISVSHENLGFGQYMQQLQLSFASGTGPDVFMGFSNNATTFAGFGAIGPIDDVVDTAEYTPAALSVGTVDGELMFLPFAMNAKVLFYRADQFTEVGLDPADPPATWDEFRDAAIALTVRDGSGNITRSGFSSQNNPNFSLTAHFYQFLRSAGGEYFSDDGSTVRFNSPEGAEALQFLVDLVVESEVDVLGAEHDEIGEFGAGTISMAITGDWVLRGIEDESVVGVAAVPSNGATWCEIGGDSLFLSSETDQPDAAAELYRFLLNMENTGAYAAQKGRAIPANAAAAEAAGSDPILQQLVALSADCETQPAHPNWGEITTEVGPILQEAFLGREVADVLAEAEDVANGIIADNA